MRRLTGLGAAFAACMLATVAHAHGVKTKTIEIVHPWTYEGDVRDGLGVAMAILNKGRRDDRLVSATSPVARSVTVVAGPATGTAVTAGQAAPAGIPVRAGARIELTREGAHLRLDGVKKALGPYDTFSMTLVFERAGRVQIEVLVEERSTPAPGHK